MILHCILSFSPSLTFAGVLDGALRGAIIGGCIGAVVGGIIHLSKRNKAKDGQTPEIKDDQRHG